MERMTSYKYKYKYFIILSPQGFSGIISNTVWGAFARLLEAQFTINEVMSDECPLM